MDCDFPQTKYNNQSLIWKLHGINIMVKRTWQPKKLKRARRFGFLRRMATACGRKILAARRAKGRAKLVTA